MVYEDFLKCTEKKGWNVEFKSNGPVYCYDDPPLDRPRCLSSRLCKCCEVLCTRKRGTPCLLLLPSSLCHALPQFGQKRALQIAPLNRPCQSRDRVRARDREPAAYFAAAEVAHSRRGGGKNIESATDA